ncbi:unnamed protein product [Cyprideis torosa]|uniref:Uncharacterized protein n=1 Tax=Cyprideis torosa TaxID=163714 RepID=A0A7R8ZNL9_9CRUS|nr:unnamed protein product [Cyprideis torosa]CAG0898288.1 unnamed protein product [Cyprideis torosa]
MEPSSSTEGSEICQLCREKPSKYICPRCSKPYCSMKCFRLPAHYVCSEPFYKDRVMEEIGEQRVSSESRKKMLEILRRNAEPGVEEPADELDSDDEDNPEVNDLSERLQGVDIDDPDALWSALTAEERTEFQRQLQTNEIVQCVPKFSVWWKRQMPLVIEADASDRGKPSLLPEGCPKIRQSPPLSQLTSVAPSPLIAFSVLNFFAAYCHTVTLHLGEHMQTAWRSASELLRMCVALHCDEPGKKATCEISSAQEALVLAHQKITALDPSAAVNKGEMSCDVLAIIRGPYPKRLSAVYATAALSDAHSWLKKAITEAKGSRSPPPPSAAPLPALRFALRRIEFFHAWYLDHGESCLGTLAMGVCDATDHFIRLSADERWMSARSKDIALMIAFVFSVCHAIASILLLVGSYYGYHRLHYPFLVTCSFLVLCNAVAFYTIMLALDSDEFIQFFSWSTSAVLVWFKLLNAPISLAWVGTTVLVGATTTTPLLEHPSPNRETS